MIGQPQPPSTSPHWGADRLPQSPIVSAHHGGGFSSMPRAHHLQPHPHVLPGPPAMRMPRTVKYSRGVPHGLPGSPVMQINGVPHGLPGSPRVQINGVPHGLPGSPRVQINGVPHGLPGSPRVQDNVVPIVGKHRNPTTGPGGGHWDFQQVPSGWDFSSKAPGQSSPVAGKSPSGRVLHAEFL